jgi:pyrroline-5-carboxylate reductase
MVSEEKVIGFIGAGNMASALVKGLLSSGTLPRDRIRVSDRSQAALEMLLKQFGVRGYGSNRQLARECEIVVLSVKPQIMREVLEEIKADIRDNHMIISIAAGIPLGMIQDILRREIPLIRVMPNTPALIQRGISALAAGKWAEPSDMDIATGIFEAVGETVIVAEETMDAVTAISGSGPGYVFKIMESFVSAGETLGFDRETSHKLVLQTFLGAVHLARESEKTLSRLREMVTSPGGTTAAGLAVFRDKGIDALILETVTAACNRSQELGKNY